jgi:hypothetical protein
MQKISNSLGESKTSRIVWGNRIDKTVERCICILEQHSQHPVQRKMHAPVLFMLAGRGSICNAPVLACVFDPASA